MTTKYYEDQSSSWGLIIAGLLVVLGLGLVMITFTDHSQVSHAEQVPDITNCFNGSGMKSGWYIGPDGRYAQYCIQGDNLYWRISECDGANRIVVTQFKQALRKLTNYLTNKRYVESSSPPCN